MKIFLNNIKLHVDNLKDRGNNPIYPTETVHTTFIVHRIRFIIIPITYENRLRVCSRSRQMGFAILI